MRKKCLLAALLAIATPAAAHDWYPMECCSSLDCAPVEKVEMLPGPSIANMLSTPAHAAPIGGMLVTTKHGSVVVPADFPRRESKDHRMHACIRPAPGGTGMRLLCIFFPPAI
ncbi:MAG: hypothetical protein AB7O44_22940 [Hyphomicrobiaceae bacterium]